MLVRDTITKKLKEAFTPESIDVRRRMHLHEGHAGHRPGGQSHFRVYIVSQAFAGKSRIDRHRMINAVLADDLAGGVHALAIHASAPGSEQRLAEARTTSPTPRPRELARRLGARQADDSQRGDAVALPPEHLEAEAVEGEALPAFGIERDS